jgi:DNA-binding transcriptional ArsR family regulator
VTDQRETPFGPDPETDVVLDAKGLRALAHPMRVQLAGSLRTYGPSTATRLGERMGITSGTASYHLRRPGAAGPVVVFITHMLSEPAWTTMFTADPGPEEATGPENRES